MLCSHRSYGAPNPAGCQQRYVLDDVVADIRSSGHNVTHTCFVECGAMFSKAGPVHLRSLGEVFFAQGAASASESGTYGTAQICAGITGTVDLSLPTDTLQSALEYFMRVPNFRGIRSSPTDAGLAILEKLGVVFETGLGADTAKLAQKFPALKIVMNHCCFRLPTEDDGGKSLSQWKRNVAAVAEYPNVFAKVALQTALTVTVLHSAFRKLIDTPAVELTPCYECLVGCLAGWCRNAKFRIWMGGPSGTAIF